MSTTIPIPASSNRSDEGNGVSDESDVATKLQANWQSGDLWSDATPASLKNGWAKLSPADRWTKWTQHLANRKSPAPESKNLSGKADPLLWGLPNSPAHASDWVEASTWLAELDQNLPAKKSKAAAANQVQVEALVAELIHGLRNPAAGTFQPTDAWRAVAAAYRLAALAPQLSSENWWRLAALLLALAADAEAATSDDASADEALVAALIAGELPLVLSVQLAELKPCRQLRAAGKKALGEGLLASTDGEGLIDAEAIRVVPVLFSCWTRCRAIGESLKKGCWSPEAETQFEWVVRQTLRLSRVDGMPMLTDGAYANWPAGPLDTALDLAGDIEDDAAANHHLGKLLTTNDGDYEEDDLPDADAESEWSSLGLLADGWGKKANRVLVDYSGDELGIEIESQGRTLLTGKWATTTILNGKELSPEDDWEQQCWFSDEDCDFLDLVLELSGGAKLERQLFLGKDDGFLVVHDILHAPEGSLSLGANNEWQHTSQLPLAANMEFAPEKETRDGTLVDGKGSARATVVPLALAEWRVETRFGDLSCSDSTLELVQTAKGARLSCPLWLDLRPRRTTKPRTWRRLTVAESLEVCPNDRAVAYRVQVGDAQWLVYRSLAPPANRTFLGQNTACEMLVGRFLRTGELDELLEVDPAD